MIRYLKLSFEVVFFSTFFLWAAGMALAQSDPLLDARNFPPNTYKTNEHFFSTLDWQIKQLDSLINKYSKSRNDIRESLAEMEISLENRTRQTPEEIRGLTSEVRSELIGDALKQLLDSKLELAALESRIKTKQENDKSEQLSKLRQQELAIKTEKARKRYQLAVNEAEKTMQLRKAGSISEQQANRAKTSAEIAKLEHQAAVVSEKLEMEGAKARAAASIADSRMEIGPLKARIKIVEQFLKKISSANRLSREIENGKFAKDLLRKDLQLVAAQLFDLNRQKTELVSLRELMLKNLKSNTAKPETESKEKD